MSKLNWKPVVGSLLKVLQDHNFELQAADDGEDTLGLTGTPRSRRQKAKSIITSVDESSLLVSHPSLGKRAWLHIVLGNSPEETVADHSVTGLSPCPLEAALEQFSRKWEGKPCPRY